MQTIEQKRAYNRDRYNAKRQKGLCGGCGARINSNKSRCEPCLIIAAGYYWKRRANHLCARCAEPLGREVLTECFKCRINK